MQPQVNRALAAHPENAVRAGGFRAALRPAGVASGLLMPYLKWNQRDSRRLKDMPRYVFFCKQCQKEFEKTLRMDEVSKAQVKCPHCNGEQVEQHLAAFSAVTSKKS